MIRKRISIATHDMTLDDISIADDFGIRQHDRILHELLHDGVEVSGFVVDFFFKKSDFGVSDFDSMRVYVFTEIIFLQK
jgi:hypothetical protein